MAEAREMEWLAGWQGSLRLSRRHTYLEEKVTMIVRRVRDHTTTGSSFALTAAATAVAAVGVAALAIGALAIGRLAVQRATLSRGSIKRLEIDELVVNRLRVREVVDEDSGT
jgi:hypothetical protein